MKIKVCDSPVYLHATGGGLVHIDIEHPLFSRIITEGERAFCQGKGEHGMFINLDPGMTERARKVMRLRSVQTDSGPVLLQHRIVRALDDIADILSVLGEDIRSMAYRRAARSIEGTPLDLLRLTEAGELTSIRGVGRTIASRIYEYVRTGRIEYLDELRNRIPEIAEILKMPQIRLTTAMRLHQRFGVSSIEDLERIVGEGRLILGPQPITEEDIIKLQIFRRRAGGFSETLDVLTEGLAYIEQLRRRFNSLSIAYDIPRGYAMQNLLSLLPHPDSGIGVLFGKKTNLPSTVDIDAIIRDVSTLMGETLDRLITNQGRISFRLLDSERARQFVDLVGRCLEV